MTASAAARFHRSTLLVFKNNYHLVSSSNIHIALQNPVFKENANKKEPFGPIRTRPIYSLLETTQCWIVKPRTVVIPV
jgi:hypothetical protein